MPAVSVIVPVYNTEKYIRKCLDSLTAQTLRDIEIICVNDCSTDGSLDILREYAARDARIKIIDFEQNRGAAAARNTGIDAATGEYIGFVDSDDYVAPDFYEKLYTKAIDTGADVVKGTLACLKDGKTDIDREAGYDTNKLIKENKAYFFHSFTTAVYNSQFLRKHNLYFPLAQMFEDPCFSINVSIHANQIYICDNAPKYYYVYNSTSLTKTIDNNTVRDALNSIQIILSLIAQENVDYEFKRIVSAFVFKQLQGYCWIPTVCTELNRQSMDLYTKIYDTFGNKDDLITEYMKQAKAIRLSRTLKIAKLKLSNQEDVS